ncbi:MAG: hypothetical protein QXY40_03265 [Candidatus Methanomethylicia archaeon]
MNTKRNIYLTIVPVTTAFIISLWIHHPNFTFSFYSDIVWFWYRVEVASGKIPYIEYNFEYPVISGLIVYLASLTKYVESYYLTISLVIYLCLLGSLILTLKIARNIEPYRVLMFTVFTSSFIIYSVYSFDWIGNFLLILSIYFFLHKKLATSGFTLGLAGATRIIPLICMLAFISEIKDLSNRAKYIVATILGLLIPNIYFLVKNFNGAIHPYIYQATWRVEDSWIAIVPFNHQLASLIVMTIMITIVMLKWSGDIIFKCGLLLFTFMISSYKFPPQYFIQLLPFSALTTKRYSAFVIADLLNSAIILGWFTPSFSFGDPWLISSPVQWCAVARQTILLYIVIDSLRPNKTINSS